MERMIKKRGIGSIMLLKRDGLGGWHNIGKIYDMKGIKSYIRNEYKNTAFHFDSDFPEDEKTEIQEYYMSLRHEAD